MTQMSKGKIPRMSHPLFLSMAQMQRSFSKHMHLAKLFKTAMRSMFSIFNNSLWSMDCIG